MADKLRAAAQQLLAAWQTATYGHPSHHKATLLAMTDLKAALAQQAEPVERPSCEDLGYVALSEDGRSVFIDGIGLVPLAQQAEPAQPVATFDDPYRDHWAAIAEAAQKIAASNECGPAEAKALCAALDRLTEATLAEPVAWRVRRRSEKFWNVCQHAPLDAMQDPRLEVIALVDAVDQQHAEPVQRTPATGAAPCVPSPTFQMTTHAEPVQRKPLTEEEIDALSKGVNSEDKGRFSIIRGFARAVEAAHGIKGEK